MTESQTVRNDRVREQRGPIGLVTLNRPESASTRSMSRCSTTSTDVLDVIESDD